MSRVHVRVLLLIIAHLPLLCAELSHPEETSSISGNDEAKPSCMKDCEDRTRVRKRSTLRAKCELYYFVPTAKHTDEAFFFWDNKKTEQLEAYYKIVPFLQANSHEEKPLFFPAHLPLAEKRKDGSEVLVLKDVYVRALGTCGEHPGANDRGYFDTDPKWFKNPEQKLQVELRILEDYVQRLPRSHWGYRVPKDDELDVCLDNTGLVVKDFPGIRTCFSMWIYDNLDQNPKPKPKHFAGRQIYNRINQTLHVNASKIGFDPSGVDPNFEPIGTEPLSLPALFLNEMCHVSNESLENSCAYWATNRFYVSLCCCYTNRRECAYKNYTFPAQKKKGDPVIRACAAGDYYVMKSFGCRHEPSNTVSLAKSVKEFVEEMTSSQVCKWIYTWDPGNETDLKGLLQVYLDAVRPADFYEWMLTCTANSPDGSCCWRTDYRCPMDQYEDTDSIIVECFCSDGDLCNKRHSYMDKDLVSKFNRARPCETQTAAEHLLLKSAQFGQKKPNTSETTGYTCAVYYNFAHPGRPKAFLSLVNGVNYIFNERTDERFYEKIFLKDGCQLAEVTIREKDSCGEKLFGEHSEEETDEHVLILLCVVEGNPLGENRTSYPDAELKKTVAANLTAAKAEFPTCKNGSWSLDFGRLSVLVVDNSKLERMYDNITDGTNDNITTAHCFVEVSFVYQQQYDFTFGAVSVDNKPLHDACHDSEPDDNGSASKCVRLNSTADNEHQRFACCCRRIWSQPNDVCHKIVFDQLKTLLDENVVAETPAKIMGELEKDPLTKCDDEESSDEVQAGDDLNRPCARNDGCYTGVHARDVPRNTQHKEFYGCVSEYAPDAKKRDDAKASNEVEARFSRICRLARDQDQCFAVLGTEDTELPADVRGPQIVCCCDGHLDTAKKCGTSHKIGMKIGDFGL